MAGFERLVEDFDDAGVRVIALSADDREGAELMRKQEDLTFPVAFGVDVDEAEYRLGIYAERGERTHLQPAQLVLDPEARVRFASYSSGKVGRLSGEEALGEVESLVPA